MGFLRNISNSVSISIASSSALYKTVHPLIKFFKGIEYQKKQLDLKPHRDLILRMFGNRPEVRNGIFKGMKYPDFKSFGSVIFPKILGSYELEVADIFKEAANKSFDAFIDIGSAEGYYSVGLARFDNISKVIAADIDKNALALSMEIASLNGVKEKIEFIGGLDPLSLRNLSESKRNFILSDCEGYEAILFNKENIDSLRNSDVLIETHEASSIGVVEYLKQLFSSTHDVMVITAKDDYKKLTEYSFPELGQLPLQTRLVCVSEHRSYAQEWLFMTPKTGI